jgi:putative phosphoribosyl transferase
MLGAPLFRDRREAGRRLADALVLEPGPEIVVVGLARGGVVVAAEVALALGAPLDALAVRKVRHPFQPEYALGAVAPGGVLFLRGADGLSPEAVAQAVAEASAEADELDRRLHEAAPPLELDGRRVLLVDDGLATGATMVAAVRHARARGAASVIVAVPVAAAESAERLREEADAVVCPFELELFGAVGFWYEDFTQVDDEDVARLLGDRSD